MCDSMVLHVKFVGIEVPKAIKINNIKKSSKERENNADSWEEAGQ